MFYLQFLLAAAIVLTAKWWPPEPLALAASAPGILIAVSAWRAIGLANIRVHESTTDDTQLVTAGPYRWIRHPMYSGQLLFTAALLASGFQWYRVGLWIALLIVLWIKSAREEIYLRKTFDEYSAYERKTKRFFPGLI